MKIIRILFLCLVTLAASAQTNVIYFKVGDILSGSGAPNLVNLKVTLTDTTGDPRMVNGVLISPQVKTAYSKSDGKAYFNNVVYGNYNVQLVSSPLAAFDISVTPTTTGIVDGATLRGTVFFPSPLESFYTKEQVDTLFSDFQGGIPLSLLLSTSNSLQSQITSGGVTAPVATNMINTLSGVVVTNGANLTLQFSSAGTNAIQAIAQPLVNTASNTLATSSAALGVNLTNDINTTSNSLALTSQTIANTTSNSLQTGINTLGSNLTNDVNTTSNTLATLSQTIANTSSNSLQTGMNTLGSNLTNDVNTTSNALQSQITSGGITAVQATNIINGLTGDVGTNGANLTLQFTSTGTNDIKSIAQPLVNTASNTIVGRTITVAGTANQITSSAGAQDLSANRTWTFSLPNPLIAPGSFTAAIITNLGIYYGDGSQLTNLLNLGKFTAGANIVLTPTKDTGTGSTNFAIAVADPASFGQVNMGSLYATNMFTPTNVFAGAVADFSKGEWTTNLSGNLTFTGIANSQADAYNGMILHAYPGGSDRTISVPGSWHIGRGSLMVVSNAFNHADFMITAQIGLSTNIAELDYP